MGEIEDDNVTTAPSNETSLSEDGKESKGEETTKEADSTSGEESNETASEDEGKTENESSNETTSEDEEKTEKESEESAESQNDTSTESSSEKEEEPKKKKTKLVEKIFGIRKTTPKPAFVSKLQEMKKTHRKALDIESYHIGKIQPLSKDL